MHPTDIKAIREKLGLTQTEFGELIGKSMRTIQTYESGQSVPGGKAMVKLQELFAQHIVQDVRIKNDVKGSFIKDGVEISMDDVATFAANNEDIFFAHKYFSNYIELKITKKLNQLLRNTKELKKFLDS